ncbi:MAG TPA: lanthionine synthetase LanC family protein, partial [Gemmatimonadaceae bacterium]
IYTSALRRGLHPRYLRDGFEHSLQLEVLRLSVLNVDERVAYWPAFDAEQRDLEDLDLPYFWALTDGTELHDSRGLAVGAFNSTSAYDQVIDRLGLFDRNDRDHQESLIRFIYAYSAGPIATVGPAPVATVRAAPVAGGPTFDASDALAEARAIANALESLVLRRADGSAQWVGVDRARSLAGLVLRGIGDRLYDGRAGTALFLAALDAVCATGHTALAAEALEPMRRTLRDERQRARLTSEIGIGAGFGVGGFVYTLGQIGRLSGDARWIDDAIHAARAVTPARIAGDTGLEVLGGSAGAALALSSLWNITGDRWLLERADACGRHLLASAAREPVTGRAVWRLQGGQFGTGFAHGAGGIGAALLRLATATDDDRFAAAADEAFAFEAAVRDSNALASAHLAAASAKARSESPWMQTWCNGPVGVAIARGVYGSSAPAGAVELAGSPDVTTSPDHPCCGTLGRAELLLVAGSAEAARTVAGSVVARARARGSYEISRDVPEARIAPSFFQGLSGIGYQLLRITHPRRLPSVLAIE